jgi:hypothetical protein
MEPGNDAMMCLLGFCSQHNTTLGNAFILDSKTTTARVFFMLFTFFWR